MTEPNFAETPNAVFQSGIACLSLVARLHGLPADPDNLNHRFTPPGRPLSMTGLLRAARFVGLKARNRQSNWEKLQHTPLPAIAEFTDGHYVVVARIGRHHVLVLDPLAAQPRTLSQTEFETHWNGQLVLITRRAKLGEELRTFDFSWFIPAINKYRRLFAEVFVAAFFLQLFALITPLFFQVVIDKVLVHRGLTTLDVLAIGLLVVSVFEVLLGGLRTYVFSHTTNRIDVTLGAKLFKHLLSLPIDYFGARRVGDTVARVRELESIRNFITGSALTVVIDLMFSFVFLTVMYYYSPTLCSIVLGAIPCYVVLSVSITPLLRARLKEKFSRGAENQAFLVEAINGIETVKASAVEPQSEKRWEEQLAGYVNASFRANNLGNIANQIASIINKATVVLILWVGARLVINGELSVGQLIAFNMLAARVSTPVLRLVQLWQDFQQAGVSVARLGDILNAKPEPFSTPSRGSLPALQGRVALQHVTFRYRPERPDVLHDISLDISPGEIIGVVGASGSGKSTLTKLIQRLHVPQSGRVLVDGVDLTMVDPAWLRRSIGVVLQENFLFNRSVRENIALSDPSLPIEPVVVSAKLAGAHEFILELPEGYDTVIGEQGSNLSGGQRQRLAIARALVTDPRILIFDEATSALDYESERLIQENMQAICAHRAVLIIAHRLTAIRAASRILVLHEGRVVEHGTHASLMDVRGQYARLYALQSGNVQAVTA